ncbi:diacylglycerol/lipid kinase family protein [Planococcus salinus]|uniref:Diacylglycerol kinase family lipid kinase n=1 Tax=Planococcus salinus TaxID=1848460 RepID=A0A3M8PAR1_9BACL|nr:diacylglycerol kinase family protein [Planococcus salinus]RNF40796.1 diacylglycerol kinase family lipid kinase [Planococcus salinus]
MKIAFIINPEAGNGKSVKKWRAFEKTIHFPYEKTVTRYPGHAIEIAESYRRRKEEWLLIGFGGDGTLREIIAGAAGSGQLIIGFIAAGSGNDFARGFQVFRNADEIVGFLNDPKFRKEDLGEFSNGQSFRFVSSSGIGFDAEISVLVNRSPMKKWLNTIRLGKLVYLIYVIKTLIRFDKFRLIVEESGTTSCYNDVWFATVNNQPYFGGGMKISPQSKTNDGLLELTVVHQISRLKLLFVFGTVFTGKHTRFKEVIQFSGNAFRLNTEKEVFRHVDGDFAGKTPKDNFVTYSISRQHWNSANTE